MRSVILRKNIILICIYCFFILFPLNSKAYTLEDIKEPKFTFYFEQQGQILKTNDVINISIVGEELDRATITFTSCSESGEYNNIDHIVFSTNTYVFDSSSNKLNFPITLTDKDLETKYKLSYLNVVSSSGSVCIDWINMYSYGLQDVYFTFSNNCYNGLHTGGTATTAHKAICKICGMEYGNYASGVTLNTKSSTLQVGKSTTAIKIDEKNPSDSVLKWTSSNKKVATVNKKTGKVTAVKAGTTTITVKMKSGVSASCKLKVTENAVKLKKLSFTEKTITAKKGSKVQLYVKRNPVTATEKLIYSSSSKKIATVNKKGKITAKKVGTAKITVKSTNGKKATCTVKVIK